jgi:hypothetical protein
VQDYALGAHWLTRTIMGAMRKPANERLFPVKLRKSIPYEFVLEAVSQLLSIETRSMFGCLAVYVGDKIVLLLREKQKTNRRQRRVARHHQRAPPESAARVSHMRSIQLLGKQVTGWQILPADAPDFESAALRACELIRRPGSQNRQGAEVAPKIG